MCKSFVILGFRLLSLSLSLSLCLCLCVSVSVCCVLCVVLVLVVVVVVVVGGGRRRGETNRTIWAKVSLKIAETEQPYQVKRMIGGIGDMLFKLENGKDPKVSLVNL